jgi:hypothetical protein
MAPGKIRIDVMVDVQTPLLGLDVTESAHHTAQLLVGANSGEGI